MKFKHLYTIKYCSSKGNRFEVAARLAEMGNHIDPEKHFEILEEPPSEIKSLLEEGKTSYQRKFELLAAEYNALKLTQSHHLNLSGLRGLSNVGEVHFFGSRRYQASEYASSRVWFCYNQSKLKLNANGSSAGEAFGGFIASERAHGW
ncbi:hypothetical protein NMG60_11032546 [Bertholletia excelsa]